MTRATTSPRPLLAAALLVLVVAGGARAQSSEETSAPNEAAADEEQPNSSSDGAPADSGEQSNGDAAPGTWVQAFAGFGVGTRSMERPTRVGAQRLKDAFFPAAEGGLRVLSSTKSAFSLGFLLHYQTSIGMTVTEEPLFALSNRLAVRSERVEVSVAPTFRLADSKQSLALAFPIGASLRTFWPEVHEPTTSGYSLPQVGEVHEPTTPGYSLLGPQVRAELVAPLTSTLGLRIGPEVVWIISIDRSLQSEGVAAQGLAIGGEALLELQLGAIFAIQLAYRESHAFAPNTGTGPTFSDVERFLTGRLAGAL